MTAAPAEKAGRLIAAMAILAAAGVLVSSFSLYHHFSKSKTSFCDIAQSFSCDLVNRSQYSSVLGVPVALIGILGYLLLLALATIYRRKAETPFMLVIAAIFGLGFALYLTYVEAFVLGAWCILCLASLGLITSISVLAVLNLLVAYKRAP